jgi:hypothetical protein
MKKKYGRYPCQISYDKKRPLLSFRVDPKEKEKIKKMVKDSYVGVSELVRIALLDLEKDFSLALKKAEAEGLKKGKEQGENDGYKAGFQDGENKWAIWVNCYRCHGRVYVEPNSKMHQEIIDRQKGYYFHRPDCPP